MNWPDVRNYNTAEVEMMMLHRCFGDWPYHSYQLDLRKKKAQRDGENKGFVTCGAVPTAESHVWWRSFGVPGWVLGTYGMVPDWLM
jgi:hypothetical protein